MYDYEVPEYYKYITWYDLNKPLDIYNFVQEMINDGVDLNNYPDIKAYYDVIYNNAFSNKPNIISVEYAVKRIKRLLVNYGFAHSTAKLKNKLYYYWFERGE